VWLGGGEWSKQVVGGHGWAGLTIVGLHWALLGFSGLCWRLLGFVGGQRVCIVAKINSKTHRNFLKKCT
jgi:hypothetical protein